MIYQAQFPFIHIHDSISISISIFIFIPIPILSVNLAPGPSYRTHPDHTNRPRERRYLKTANEILPIYYRYLATRVIAVCCVGTVLYLLTTVFVLNGDPNTRCFIYICWSVPTYSIWTVLCCAVLCCTEAKKQRRKDAKTQVPRARYTLFCSD